MKSNYKPLGQYLKPVSIRNSQLQIKNLIGLSIQKKFIPSISNTIGTDMSTGCVKIMSAMTRLLN